MTEDQIELLYEMMQDRLDEQLLEGLLSDADYESKSMGIHEWALRKYKELEI